MARGDAERGAKKKDSPEAAKTKKILVVAFIIGIIFAIVILVLVVGFLVKAREMEAHDLKDKFCDRVNEYVTSKRLEGTGLDKTPEVVEINTCRRMQLECTFSVLSCRAPCPLGFVTENNCAVSCECATRGQSQLDIQFDEETMPAMIEQMNMDSSDDFTVFSKNSGIQLWNDIIVDGRVQIPCKLDQNLAPPQKATIMEAFGVFKEKTCIDFVPYSGEKDFLDIGNGNGDCSSSYSRHRGRNTISVASCYSNSHVIHILMHALGFHHEHMRDDRDAYINILWDNVDPAFESAFNKLSPEKNLGSDSTFDIKSIMMLDGYDFSKTKDEKVDPTMIDLDTNEPVEGGGSALTESDIDRITSVYCDGVAENARARSALQSIRRTRGNFDEKMEWSDWSHWTRCQATCGDSVQTRVRSCKLLDFRGYGCEGMPKESVPCNLGECQNTGTWSDWSAWGNCTRPCGTGYKYRNRQCSIPGMCKGQGSSSAMRKCNTERCPDEKPLLSPWTDWAECSATCGKSYVRRERKCTYRDGVPSMDCGSDKVGRDGLEYETKVCEKPTCPESSAGKARSRSGARSALVLPPKISDMERKEAFDEASTKIAMEVCDPLPNHHWFLGDFNGDKRTDILCGETVDLLQLFLMGADGSMAMQWSGRLNCAIEYIIVGDFNGDGSDDLFCKDNVLARNLIYPSRDGGQFIQYQEAGPFCMNVFDKVEVMDVNGDGKADIVCKHPISNENADIYISSLSL